MPNEVVARCRTARTRRVDVSGTTLAVVVDVEDTVVLDGADGAETAVVVEVPAHPALGAGAVDSRSTCTTPGHDAKASAGSVRNPRRR